MMWLRKYSAEKTEGLINRVISVFVLLVLVFLSYRGLFTVNDQEKIVLDKNSERQGSTSKKYRVDRVIDGDSIEVFGDGKKQEVRLLGIDAPEMASKNKLDACLARRSKTGLEDKITGKEVFLEADHSQQDKDKYGRLLRYVYLGDEFINKTILSEGNAVVYNFFTVSKMDELRVAEKTAKDNRLGLWSGKCSY